MAKESTMASNAEGPTDAGDTVGGDQTNVPETGPEEPELSDSPPLRPQRTAPQIPAPQLGGTTFTNGIIAGLQAWLRNPLQNRRFEEEDQAGPLGSDGVSQQVDQSNDVPEVRVSESPVQDGRNSK